MAGITLLKSKASGSVKDGDLNMNIRRANTDDTENIVRLVKDGLKEFGFTYSPRTSEADLTDVDREYHQNGGVFLVMENNQKELIATGALKKVDDRTYKIRKMYVSKPHRKKGYGKEVLNKLLEIAQTKGAETIVLETSECMTAAINLYKNFGFMESEQKTVSPRCDITMIKKIDHKISTMK